MKLNFEQIKSISFGAAEIINENGVFKYEKCTKKQIEFMESLGNENLRYNSRGATGCCLDFHTDSNSFSFLPVEGPKYELLINNVFTYKWLCPENKVWEKVTVNLPEGENRVTLIFPNHGASCKISEVELDGNSLVKPHEYAMKMAFFGDSITHGWNSEDSIMSYAWQVARYFDAECWNVGVGGHIFREGFADKREDYEPDVVIVAYGTNDFGAHNNVENFKAELSGFLKNMAEYYKNSKIFVMLPIWRGDVENRVKPWGNFRDHAMIIKETAEGFGLNVIDAYTFLPRLRDFYIDPIMLHPNKPGFCVYAQNIIKELTGKI